jgi:hypothetical protein
VETPYNFLKQGRKVFNFGSVDIADLIALIHLINLPVVEAPRMRAALGHLESVIGLSRQSWKDLLAETDDDHEWIPNPKQSGVIPNVRITPDMVNGWSQFLDEAEAILQGKKLVPFWRTVDGRGINLRRVFTEPRTLDLVLWAQGTAAQPYLEEGPVSTPAVWARFNRLFQGEFLGFALWFN